MSPAHLEQAARLCAAPHAFHPAPEMAADLRKLARAIEHVRAAAMAREAGHITAGELESAVLESGVASWA